MLNGAVNTLVPRDLAMFARLRIPAELLTDARVQRVSDFQAKDLFGIQYSGDKSGIVFPYFIRERRVTHGCVAMTRKSMLTATGERLVPKEAPALNSEVSSPSRQPTYNCIACHAYTNVEKQAARFISDEVQKARSPNHQPTSFLGHARAFARLRAAHQAEHEQPEHDGAK